MEKVSIIVPIYNAEKTIRRCVDSILGQTYPDIEVILVNDGSKDKSGSICEEYAGKDNRVKYIDKENSGVSASRNMGLRIASGEYVTFVDADDYIADRYIESLVTPFKDKDVCLSEVAYKDNTIDEQSGYKCVFEESIDKRIIKYLETLGYVWGKLFKKSIITENNMSFAENLIMSEDLEYLIRYLCFAKGKIAFIDNYLYCYCVSDGSITRSRDYHKLKNRLDAGLIIRKDLVGCQKNADVIDAIDTWILKNTVWVSYDYFYDCVVNKKSPSKEELNKILGYADNINIDRLKNHSYYKKYVLLQKCPKLVYFFYWFKKRVL